MRSIALAFLIPLAACGNSGGGHVSGAPVTAEGSGPARSYRVADFNDVALSGIDDVEVRTGGAFSVRAEGDPAALARLVIAKDGDTLRIGRKGGWSNSDHGAKVFVTMPRLARASVSGTGDINVDRVTGDAFAASASGTGTVRVAAAQLGKADVSISGAGDVVLAGTARHLSAQVSGTGGLDARALKAAGADVSVTGTGDVRAMVNGPATVSASGTGDVDLGPGARCTISKSGTGDVRCGG
jgi:hypothetical protein